MNIEEENKIKNNLVCAQLYDLFSNIDITYTDNSSEKQITKIIKSLGGNNISALDDFISHHEEIDTIFNPTAISILNKLEEDGSKTKDIFYIVLDQLYNFNPKKSVSYTYLKETGELGEALQDLESMAQVCTLKVKEDNLFVITGHYSSDYKLIATEDTIFYKTDNGKVDVIPMDGLDFVFNGQNCKASIDYLKMLEIIHYDSDLIVKDNLTNKPEPKPEVKATFKPKQ